jgi:hypothetical protein
MEPAAFRAEADAFETKVVGIRKAQDDKARALGTRRDAERAAFFERALPFFGDLMRERGAVVILDARAIFIAANAIDVTDAMIALLDARLGDGAGIVASEPEERSPEVEAPGQGGGGPGTDSGSPP